MEYEKVYDERFSDNNYNLHNNNEYRFRLVLDYLAKYKTESFIDMGSGRGNVIGEILKNHKDIEILSCDLKKYHNFDVPFEKINLCDKEIIKLDKVYDLLSCLDVLEHIEKECVDNVFLTFGKICKNAVITIANHSDIQNGVELHTIQEDMTYWKPLIEKHFTIKNFSVEYNGRLYLLKLKSKYNE